MMKKLFLLLSVLFLAAQMWGAPAKKKPVSKEKTATLSVGDWTLPAVYLAPEKDGLGELNPVVLLVHDMGKSKDDFSALKQDLTDAGFGYFAFDLRGYGQSKNKQDDALTARKFAKEGEDNEFNQMSAEVKEAFMFLKNRKIPADKIFLLGCGLGANLVSKATLELPQVGGIALISPAANIRDVLAIPPLRKYNGDILIAASADDKKAFLEASVIRNAAFLSSGEGKVTFLTAYDLSSHEMLDKYLRPLVMQWFRTPHKPEVAPDANVVDPFAETDLSGIDLPQAE